MLFFSFQDLITFGDLEVERRAEKFVKKSEEIKKQNKTILRVQGETVKSKLGEKER